MKIGLVFGFSNCIASFSNVLPVLTIISQIKIKLMKLP